MNAQISAADALQQRGLFTFEPAAYGLLDVFSTAAPLTEHGARPVDLTALTAAEFSLARLFTHPQQPAEPVAVRENAVATAALKTDCLSIQWCSAAELSLMDITAFSADMSKLQHVGMSPIEPPTLDRLVQAVDDLELAHRESPVPHSQQFGESGLQRFQGFLWGAKLLLPGSDNALQAIDDSAHAFGI